MPVIRNNFDESKFDAYVDGAVAGSLHYRILNGQMWLLDLVVDAEYHGSRSSGLKDALVQKALTDAHRRRLSVLPFCHESRKHIVSHPAYIRLVPSTQRKRFLKSVDSRHQTGTRRFRQQSGGRTAVPASTGGR
ncbi:N-acetyltransferase [Arthrobacter sp. I2-34]|uniref:N-acetyltransferase n=1 Tax=Arthrobacter hankyongi TaxID=2904801 RepID=A0ABS9L2C8_9MICC|nr:N-acetyltransferase [Arthrobacter hankyongi]MCG2620816.1 N-acetyltransferase [Arthrobacter hankyongi]